MFDLTNRTAIVTGGAAGIGKGVVASLREAGANVIIADIDVEDMAARRDAHCGQGHGAGDDEAGLVAHILLQTVLIA